MLKRELKHKKYLFATLACEASNNPPRHDSGPPCLKHLIAGSIADNDLHLEGFLLELLHRLEVLLVFYWKLEINKSSKNKITF